jgi:hypothetical protein
MKASNLTAPGLRIILIVSLAILIIGGSVGFVFLRKLLVAKATDTAAVVAKVADGDKQLRSLQEAQSALNENASIERKVSEMVPAQASYEYQDKIVLSIIGVAKKAGVEIKNIDYSSGTGAATSAGGTSSGITLPGGISSTTASITFESPLRYDHWLAFVHYIEMNLQTLLFQ